MDTYLKAFVTIAGLWMMLHFASFPSGFLANLGERLVGSYGNWIGLLLLIFLTLSFIIGVGYIWNL